MIRVQAEPFDAAALLAAFSARAAGAGAIASFTGLVRGENDGAAVSGLELDHHPGLTEQALASIEADAVARFELTEIAIVHRHGALAPGEAIVFVAAAAEDSGMTRETFTCRAEGFMPQGSNRPVRDFDGEVHGTIGLQDAFKVSCNQYFSQLGLKLGKERLANYARRLGFSTSPDDKTFRSTDLWQIMHGSQDRFDYIFAPPVTKMNLAAKATSFDVALQSFGQGYDDLTVMYMALITAAASSPDGAFVAPTFEVGAQRKIVNPFISPQAAAQVRALMRLVVEQGTASGAFAPLAGRITAGGKTGTADRDVPVYDKQGNPVVDYVDKDGDKHYKIEGWTDSWFVGIAPADNPQIVYAVMVENGGQGARAAAPIAVKLIAKAAQLGYIKGVAASPAAPPAAPGKTAPGRSRGNPPANR